MSLMLSEARAERMIANIPVEFRGTDSPSDWVSSPANVSVTIEVIAEVIYVLIGVYSLERGRIVDTVKEFLSLVSCREQEVLNTALDTYKEHNLDFVDCVLFAYHSVRGFEIATFDHKLLKLINKTQ